MSEVLSSLFESLKGEPQANPTQEVTPTKQEISQSFPLDWLHEKIFGGAEEDKSTPIQPLITPPPVEKSTTLVGSTGQIYPKPTQRPEEPPVPSKEDVNLANQLKEKSFGPAQQSKPWSIKDPEAYGRTRAPIRLMLRSIFSLDNASNDVYSDNDLSIEAKNILVDAAKNAIKKGKRPSEGGFIGVSYEDYQGKTADGLTAREMVGLDPKGEGKRGDTLGSGVIGMVKLLSKVQEDPMLEALLSIGGFSIKKEEDGNWFLYDRFNFNKKNLKGNDAYALTRTAASNIPNSPIGEDTGPRWRINLGKLDEQPKRKKQQPR